MRAVLQRVSSASVTVEGKVAGTIGPRLLILLGIATTDTPEDANWLARKIATMRIFSDHAGLMNLDLTAINGEVLVVSQFTLLAAYQKGNRPSFIRAARPEQAIPLYNHFNTQIETLLNKPPQTGIFGADMKVTLTNDGPVTITMEFK